LNGSGDYANRANHPWPTLVLLDLKMPRATGFEILKWIRKRPDCKNLPVIVLSGSELQEDMRQAYLLGANSYLVKPLGFDALVTLVKSVTTVWLAPRPPAMSPLARDSRGRVGPYQAEP
jgi:CheY-like chemotaxis protein